MPLRACPMRWASGDAAHGQPWRIDDCKTCKSQDPGHSCNFQKPWHTRNDPGNCCGDSARHPRMLGRGARHEVRPERRFLSSSLWCGFKSVMVPNESEPVLRAFRAMNLSIQELMAEGEVLAANSLRGLKRSPLYSCGNCRSGSFTQDCASSRRAETADFRSHPKLLFS